MSRSHSFNPALSKLLAHSLPLFCSQLLSLQPAILLPITGSRFLWVRYPGLTPLSTNSSWFLWLIAVRSSMIQRCPASQRVTVVLNLDYDGFAKTDLFSRVQTNETGGKKGGSRFEIMKINENHPTMKIVYWTSSWFVIVEWSMLSNSGAHFWLDLVRSSSAGFSKCTRWLSMMHIRELRRMQQCQNLGNWICGCQSKWGPQNAVVEVPS